MDATLWAAVLPRVKTGAAGLSVVLCMAAGLLACTPTTTSTPAVSAPRFAVDGAVPERTTLEQGWDDATRRAFWFAPQGSRIMPYVWFAWLEQPDSQALFRSTAHMSMLGYLPATEGLDNPAGLPIGFTTETDAKSGEAFLGLTCAACHTNQIDYRGTRYLIEGAPTLANFVLFYDWLTSALDQTSSDDARFARFAERVAGASSGREAAALRERLRGLTADAVARREANALPAHYPEDFTSYARLDAFGNIQNAASVFAINEPGNGHAPVAPVSYPFLWGTHQSDVVQWNASAPNTPVIGPLVRNMGEVVGVFGNLRIKPTPWWQRLWGHDLSYHSTINIPQLGRLEAWVSTLRSPEWPAEFPQPDPALVAEGEAHYERACAMCHEVVPRDRELAPYVSVKTPVAVVRTDPATAEAALKNMARTGLLEGHKSKVLAGAPFGPTARSIDIAVNGVAGVAVAHLREAARAGVEGERASGESLVQLAKRFEEDVAQADAGGDEPPLVYKARPLNGIWATAPYLHNGSVPSLWELMKKPAERVASFHVGAREFDPVEVGFVTDAGPSEFRVLDAEGNIVPGNSNRGHPFGTGMNDAKKRALIEYMKTL